MEDETLIGTLEALLIGRILRICSLCSIAVPEFRALISNTPREFKTLDRVSTDLYIELD
jgi:hypothetical protein